MWHEFWTHFTPQSCQLAFACFICRAADLIPFFISVLPFNALKFVTSKSSRVLMNGEGVEEGVVGAANCAKVLRLIRHEANPSPPATD